MKLKNLLLIALLSLLNNAFAKSSTAATLLNLSHNLNSIVSDRGISQQDDQVIFYRDIKYSGMQKKVGPGNFSSGTLGFLGNSISSIHIPPGHTVRVNDKSGRSRTFTTSVSNLAQYGWDNKINSGFIEANHNGGGSGGNLPPQGNKVIFYKDMKYSGMSRVFSNGPFSPESLGFLKSNITSIYIPTGHSVKVYDDRGNNRTFTISVSDLTQYGWNDKITTGIISGGDTAGTLPPQGNRVIFYRDIKYTGTAKEFNQGNFGTGSLGALTNNISSIYIPQGWTVNVNDQRGRTHTFTSSVSNLMQLGWDNKIHAGFISTSNGGQHGGNQGGNTRKVVLFNNPNYSGNPTPCGEGQINYLGTNADNAISSIQLSPGYAVRVYDQRNQTGRSQTFTRSVKNLALYGWNDKISSVYVYRN
jgi:hypothetical protein